MVQDKECNQKGENSRHSAQCPRVDVAQASSCTYTLPSSSSKGKHLPFRVGTKPAITTKPPQQSTTSLLFFSYLRRPPPSQTFFHPTTGRARTLQAQDSSALRRVRHSSRGSWSLQQLQAMCTVTSRCRLHATQHAVIHDVYTVENAVPMQNFVCHLLAAPFS